MSSLVHTKERYTLKTKTSTPLFVTGALVLKQYLGRATGQNDEKAQTLVTGAMKYNWSIGSGVKPD